MDKRIGVLAVLCLAVVACGSGAPPDAVDTTKADLGNGYDQPFWRDSNFPGSTNYSGWYDSDIGWARSSIIRLPVDSKYVGNWHSKVNCTDGTVQYMNSPEFMATVNGTTRYFVINHMIQSSFYIPWSADQGWYNGGAVIGLSGGSLCNEGYPTLSSGNHFCNEVQGDDPYHFWNGQWSYSSTTYLPTYQSSCQYSNGSSGASNPACGPVCGGKQCAKGDWCGTSGQCCSGCATGCPC